MALAFAFGFDFGSKKSWVNPASPTRPHVVRDEGWKLVYWRFRRFVRSKTSSLRLSLSSLS